MKSIYWGGSNYAHQFYQSSGSILDGSGYSEPASAIARPHYRNYMNHPIVGFAFSLDGTDKTRNEDRFIVCESLKDHYLKKKIEDFQKNDGCVDSSVLERVKCFAVIDGHGGIRCAEYVTNSLLDKIVKNWPVQTAETKIPETLHMVVEKSLNSLDTEYAAIANKTRDNSGACVVAAVYLDGWLCVGNVGDSAAVLIDNKGKELEMTTLHVGSNKSELKRLSKAGGVVIDGYIQGKIVPSRTIGDRLIKAKYPGIVISDPDIQVVKIETGEGKFVPTLVLATDGLWDIGWKKAVSQIKMCSILWGNKSRTDVSTISAKDPANLLARYARASGSTDDITVIFAMFK